MINGFLLDTHDIRNAFDCPTAKLIVEVVIFTELLGTD